MLMWYIHRQIRQDQFNVVEDDEGLFSIDVCVFCTLRTSRALSKEHQLNKREARIR